ncbi:MAG TPA: zinc ribbon domain-containing protein [Phycisphaerae bacterium]|nr:zinc ribbon domain-containing protein [Phycisphaerae bacterium]
MPIYEHECRKCGKRFERMRPMSRYAEDADCPGCGGSAVRIVSVPNIETTDNFRHRDFAPPGIRPPKGGWGSRRELADALKAQGREGDLDNPATRRASEDGKKLPPIGSRVRPGARTKVQVQV